MTNIPNNAKLVFKGVLFDVYQWQQKMFDGTFATFEKIKRKPTTQIIAITKYNKIILLNEEQPNTGKFIGMPGGHVEENETIMQNAKKELLEETGMETEKLELWNKYDFGGKIEWQSHYFIAKNCTKIQEPKPENGEKITPFEVDFDEFIKYTQKKEFRNKFFSNLIFKMIHTPSELDKFKKQLFSL